MSTDWELVTGRETSSSHRRGNLGASSAARAVDTRGPLRSLSSVLPKHHTDRSVCGNNLDCAAYASGLAVCRVDQEPSTLDASTLRKSPTGPGPSFTEQALFSRSSFHSQQHETEGTGIAHTACAARTRGLPVTNVPAAWCVCHGERSSICIIAPEPGVHLRAPSWTDVETCVYPVEAGRIFPLPSHPAIHLLRTHSPPPANKAVFTVSVMLPFPEGDVVGITPCVTFSGWLLSWGHRHLSFLRVFPDLLALFLFVLRVCPSSAWIRLLIYSSSAGHLGCFQTLAITDEVTKNTSM